MNMFNEYNDKVDLSALFDYCREKGNLCHYTKGEIFTQAGYVGKYLAFIESGYFKFTTVTSEGNEAVVGFAFEGEGMCDFNNSFQNKPSEVSIVAGRDCTVYQISFKKAKEFLEAVYKDSLLKITGELFSEVYQRHLELYRKSPTERYLDLIRKYPKILNIVTMREIASFLLVTPIYLSRIRKKLSQQGLT